MKRIPDPLYSEHFHKVGLLLQVAPVPPAKLQLRHMHSQASPPVSPSAGRADKFTTIAGAVSPPLGGPTSPSVDTGDRGNPAGTPLDKHERRRASSYHSAPWVTAGFQGLPYICNCESIILVNLVIVLAGSESHIQGVQVL